MSLLQRLPEWVPWAYAAAVAACAGVVVYRWLVARWKYGDRLALAAEPRCAACGYIIAPGSSVICPECGGDLREVGLVTATTRPVRSAGPWYLLAFLAALPIGLAAAPAVRRVWPFGWRYHAVWWVDVRLGAPDVMDRNHHRLMVSATGEGRYFGRRAAQLAVTDQPPGRFKTRGRERMKSPAQLTWLRLADDGGAAGDAPYSRALLEEFVAHVAPAL